MNFSRLERSSEHFVSYSMFRPLPSSGAGVQHTTNVLRDATCESEKNRPQTTDRKSEPMPKTKIVGGPTTLNTKRGGGISLSPQRRVGWGVGCSACGSRRPRWRGWRCQAQWRPTRLPSMLENCARRSRLRLRETLREPLLSFFQLENPIDPALLVSCSSARLRTARKEARNPCCLAVVPCNRISITVH